MTILVVDDESESRTLLTAILTAEGYQVRTADGGELALASIAVKPPELILLDIRMPGMDGFEVCRLLKESEVTRQIPLMFLSARGELSERVEGFRLGAVDFVAKPFQREELLARVRTHLELGRLRAHLEELVAVRTARLHESEQHLRTSEGRLKTAQRLSHVGDWTWDIQADRILWSEEICRILGRPLDFTTDYEGFLEMVHPHERERVEQAVEDTLAGNGSDSLEFEIIRPDGEVRTIGCILEVLRDAAGSPVQIYGACQDITERRRADVAQHRSLDEIAHLNRVAAMGELTASLAHELNQPLAAILSNAQAARRFLAGENADLAQVGECLDDIADADKRAGEVIHRLQGLLKKGKSPESSVYLNDVVNDAIKLVRNDALLRQASVKFEPLRGLPPVRGDRIQLYQVVLNLIVNGFDAVAERSPGNRWVLVRTAEAEGGGVELTVEDSGKGIVESDLGRVFEPFHTTKQEGLGMGLSISRTILQAHGGRIWAERSAGHGAIFHCILPVAQQGAAAAL
jgi:PAS domain S-box-containing protein